VAGITICPFELTVAICPITSYLQVRIIVRPRRLALKRITPPK
jgi:hypothetical protein